MIEIGLIAYVSLGLCVAHAMAITRRDFDSLAQLVVIDLCAAVVTLVAVQRPMMFDDWMQEDSWAEWSTFFAFLLAGALLLWFLKRAWRDEHELGWPILGRIGFLLLGLFCLIVAGEEISWGQRLFGFLPPDVFLEHNFQQELNVHNFLTGKFDTKYQVAILAAAYGVLLPWVARIPRFRATRVGLAARACAPSLFLSPAFAAVSLVEVSYPIARAGEAAELLFGLLFLTEAAARFSRTLSWPPVRRSAGATACVAASICLGVITQPILVRMAHGSDEQAVVETRSELVLLKTDLGLPGAFSRDKNIHKRVFTSVTAGYLRLGRRSLFLEGRPTPAENTQSARRDRRGYFLDPWNSPYWIRYRRQSRRVLIYSFGPNRRRDTDTKQALSSGELAGDDIGLAFQLR